MPIKVTYQDAKGNPIAESGHAPPPISVDDKENWEALQAEAYQKGIYEDDFDKPEGEAHDLLEKYNITPEKLKAFRVDIANKVEKQRDPNILPEVTPGFSSRYKKYKTPRQVYVDFQKDMPVEDKGTSRYTHFINQDAGKAPVDYSTDIERYLRDRDIQEAAYQKQWEGFGDPKALITYHEPGTVSGFGSSPGLSSSGPAAVPDPRFPTRDDRTGRVTPPPVIVAPQLVSADAMEEPIADTPYEE